MDIVMLALPRWDGPYSSTAFSLARELARNNRVFYIDNPYTWKDVVTKFKTPQIRRRLNDLLDGRNCVTHKTDDGRQLYCVTTPPTIPFNFLPAGNIYDFFSWWNDRIFFRALHRLFKQFAIRDFLFVNVYNPFYGREFPDFFSPRLFVYYSVDNIGQSSYVSKHGPWLEAEMMRKADVALTTSKELWKQACKRTPSAFYLPNAADVGLFLQKKHQFAERPQEFAGIRTPIIIYTGHIDVRIDYDLIRAILRNHPGKTLVMIGPHSIEQSLYDELAAFPNMKFLGRRNLVELPAYLHHSHCAIIPFKCNDLTKSIYPLKVNEYLAAGLPVVSTCFSEDIQGFSEVVEIADTQEDFCRRITVAIGNDTEASRDQRVKVASRNNWEDRAHRFWEIVTKSAAWSIHSNSIAPIS